MKEWILEKLYHPVLFFFLVPMFYLVFGNIFALQYDTFRGFAFFLLYLFVLVNQMLENILLRIPKNDFEVSKPFLFSLEVLNVLLLGYFAFSYSWLAFLVLSGYTLIIQLQFLFSYYDLDHVAIITTTLLKLVLLNGFSFYVQVRFIHPRFIPIYLVLFIPFYLFEISRIDRPFKKNGLYGLVLLAYSFGIIVLWGFIGWQSLILLVTFPLASVFSTNFGRKTTSIFACIFSFVYMGLCLLTLF